VFCKSFCLISFIVWSTHLAYCVTKQQHFAVLSSKRLYYSLIYYHLIYLRTAAVGQAVYGLLVVQAFRPDRLISAAQIFVDAVMGTSFRQAAETELNLADNVENEVESFLILLCCGRFQQQ
jgi:hypothetical protein